MRRDLEQLIEPGASSRISARPLKEHGFDLNKGEFQDAPIIRYEKSWRRESPFNVTHVMNRHRGGFINQRYDDIRDYKASFLKKVCNDFQVGFTLHFVSP